MLNQSVFFSGSAGRLPPREFLRALPVRVSHLVFDEENKPPHLEELKMQLFGKDEPPPNIPIHFKMDEHGDSFDSIDVDKTTDYLTKKTDVFPSGSGWTMRWEKHIGFVTVTFYRYFTKSSNPLEAGTALAFLNESLIPPKELKREAIEGGNIDIAVIPYTLAQDKSAQDKALTKMSIRRDSPYVTRSLIFDDMAEVWMNFEVKHKDEPRPAIIFADKAMDERLAGELLQILLQIETYRAMASYRTPEKELRKAIKKLTEYERGFKEIATLIKECLNNKKQNLILELIMPEDYLPMLRKMTLIYIAIEEQIADCTTKHATSRAYRDLVITRLKDLREKPIAGYPGIEQFLRHRLEQISQTCNAIGHWQDSILQHISRLDGLLRTRMEAPCVRIVVSVPRRQSS